MALVLAVAPGICGCGEVYAATAQAAAGAVASSTSSCCGSDAMSSGNCDMPCCHNKDKAAHAKTKANSGSAIARACGDSGHCDGMAACRCETSNAQSARHFAVEHLNVSKTPVMHFVAWAGVFDSIDIGQSQRPQFFLSGALPHAGPSPYISNCALLR